MKKKILVMVLAMTLVFAYAVPVAAAETESIDAEIAAVENLVELIDAEAVPEEAAAPKATVNAGMVSDDPTIQAAYDAYIKMMEAYALNDYESMMAELETLDEITWDFTEKQEEEWNSIIEEKVGYEEFLVNVISVGYVSYTAEMYEAYKADPNAKTAFEFVEAYDLCKEAEITIELMVEGIEADYETAKTEMPSENVIEVYTAYSELAYALEFAWYDEDFIKVCEEFEAMVDIFNQLTEAELADMAVLMDVEDAEAAWTKVFTDWVNANLVLKIGEVYNAFLENPNAETAKAYIEAYDSVKNDTEFLTEDDKDVILAFFADGSYEQAKTYLEEEPATAPPAVEEPEAEQPADPAEPDQGTPQTGDESNMMVPFTVMIAAAGVAVLALKRRRVQ